MKIEVSIGESIDKLSILELKLKKITDELKRSEIQKELLALDECATYKTQYQFYYNLLMYVNEKIWDMTDSIKGLSIEKDILSFAQLSNQIFEFNQKRFRIKNWFNLITSSNIKEQKSYSASYCKICIDNEDIFYNKLAEINYLVLEYDIIIFETSFNSIIRQIFKQPTIIYDHINLSINQSITIQLSEFNIPTEHYNAIVFNFTPLIYVIGGMFGDFIQSLSVINEMFYITGRKGILYVSDMGDSFRNGVENTYKDTYPVLINQKYIHDYKIYSNELVDINLIDWRYNPNLYEQNWYNTYKQTYNVEWGKHKWINVPIDEAWINKVIINTTDYRWAYNIDFQLLFSKYGNDLIYISADESQYQHFVNMTGLNIQFYKFTTFIELCTIITSCKLFVGSLSAPLTIANAVHISRICGYGRNSAEINFNNELDLIWDNFRYTV